MLDLCCYSGGFSIAAKMLGGAAQKGKGYAPAEADREEFHWEMPFDLETGKPKVDCSGMEDYHSLTGKFLLEKMKEDHTVVAISSGTPTVIGFTPERRKQAGRQFVDETE